MATSAPLVISIHVNHLPEELLERILSYLSPYDALKQASLVCRLWHRLIQGVIRQKYFSFQHAVQSSCLQWSGREPNISPLTARYSHSACYLDKAMYVFGGCSSASTAFNDMWKLNLETREWSRVLATGMYPSPKACASMIAYKNSLLLFGGWAPPVPYPLHQAPRLFNELHMYVPCENKWCALVTSPSPPPVASHTASVVGDKMIIFGGLCGHQRSNDVWILDLPDMIWELVQIDGVIPRPRFGHSQVVVNDSCLLIIGGCGGANMMFSDMWLLRMDCIPWVWQEVEVYNEDFAAPQLWCHPACKVGDRVVVYSKSIKNRSCIPTLPLKPSPQHQRSHSQNNFVLRANVYRHHSSPPRTNQHQEFCRHHSPQRGNGSQEGRESPVHTRHGSLRRRPVVRTYSDPEHCRHFSDWETSSRSSGASSDSRESSPRHSMSRRCSLGSAPMDATYSNSASFSRCVTSSTSFGSPSRSRIFKLRHLRTRSDVSMDSSMRNFTEPVLPPTRGRYENRDDKTEDRDGRSSNSSSPTRSGTAQAGACAARNDIPENDTVSARYEARRNAGQHSANALANEPMGAIHENGQQHSPSRRAASPNVRDRGANFSSPCRKTFRSNSGTKFIPNTQSRSAMQMYVLDISDVATESHVTWQPVRSPPASPSDSSSSEPIRSGRSSGSNSPMHQPVAATNTGIINGQPIPSTISCVHGPPPETSLYTLVVGRGELIMFGGMLDDVTKITPDSKATATNAVYFAF
ncbi:uncharacterized protein LOC144451410 [Glandiceps talaboti]